MKIVAIFLIPFAASAAADGDVFFRERVEPILRERCYECHSHAGKIKGGLVLDSRSGWQSGGESGPAVVPGSVEKSRIIKAVRYADKDLQMPPKDEGGKLSAEKVAALEAWVKMGAPDPRTGAQPVAVAVADVDVHGHQTLQAMCGPAG